MTDIDYLSSKVLDPAAYNVLNVLTASLQDESTLLLTVNSVVNRYANCMIGSLGSESRAELHRLRLSLKIKQYLQTNSSKGDDLVRATCDDVRDENLVRCCIRALHDLGSSDSENYVAISTTISDILGLCLLAMPSFLYDETIKNIISLAEEKQNTSNEITMTGDTSATVNLKVLETLIDVSNILKNDYIGREGLDERFKDTPWIHNFLLNMICKGERAQAAQSLLSIVPKLMKLIESNDILIKIWEQIATFNGFDTEFDLSRVILVLVSLAEYFLPSTPSAFNHTLTSDSRFWRILALGLSSDDALIRKQAFYLAKRAGEEGVVAGGNAESRHNIWNRFLVVLATLEEKQAHLATPVMQSAERLLPLDWPNQPGDVIARLNDSFALVLLRRLLRHDQPSVAEMGVLWFLRADVHTLCGLDRETDTASILRLVMSILNTANIFTSCTDGHPTRAVEALTKLASWLPSATFSRLLEAVVAQSWNPCALFHVAHALALAAPHYVFRTDQIKLVYCLASRALATSGASVRGAVHCRLLTAMVNLSDPAELTLASVLEALSALDRLALTRGSGSWNQATTWLRGIADAFGTADTMISRELRNPSSLRLARCLVLLVDAGLADPALPAVRASLRNALENIAARTYASADAQDRALGLLAHLLDEAATVRPGCPERYLAADDIFLSLARDFRLDAIDTFTKRVSEIRDLRELNAADECVFALKQLLPCFEAGELDKLMETAVTAASLDSSPAIRQYLALKLLAAISPPPSFQSTGRSTLAPGLLLPGRAKVAPSPRCFAGLLVAGAMNVAPPREPSTNRDVAVLHGRLVSGCVSARWSLLCCLLDKTPPSTEDVPTRLQDCIDCLQLCSGAVTSHVALALALTWPSVGPSHRDLALSALDAVWTVTLELRRTDSFWTAIRGAVAAAFHPLLIGQVWARAHLNKLALSLLELAQSVVGLANVLFERLVEVADSDALQTMDALVIEGLLFGPVHRKDQRFEDETLRLIKSLGAECSVNELAKPVVGVDAKVRAMSVGLLLRATSNERLGVDGPDAGQKGWRHEACTRLALALVERHDALTSRNPRYYADSAQHRLRHRVLQGLLLITGGLDQPTSTTLLSWCWRCLGTSSHQRSVRCQLEWLAARITLAWPPIQSITEQEATNRITPCLDLAHSEAAVNKPTNDRAGNHKAANESTAYSGRGDADDPHQESVGPALACSSLVVTALVARCSRSEGNLRAGMDQALASLAAQHFNQRLHAQVVFGLLWEVCTSAGFTSLLTRFAAVDAALQAALLVPSGNAYRNLCRMKSDYFLTQLDAVADVSVLSVCHDVPRLTACPEQLAADDLIDAGASCVGTVPFRCRDSHMQIAIREMLGKEESPSHPDVYQLDGPDEQGDVDLQRKPVPSGEDPRGQRKDDGVILVASLIDKPANLGGLCRSCDIFGASLVVPRMALTQDQGFVGLSVSSQRWVPISEVRPRDLRQYLTAKKRNGFTLVGAEQTAGSVPLHRARFPRKTVLLLGNEKEGVPADLLPLLDMCVEVPQQGLIRSLNVHVTGAIFLWEISRQHHLGIEPQTLAE